MILKAIKKNRDTDGKIISTKELSLILNPLEFQKIEKTTIKEDSKQIYIFANIFIQGKTTLKERDSIIYKDKEYEIISVKEFTNTNDVIEYTKIEI